MKKVLIILFALSFISVSAQFKKVKRDKKIFIFETFDDFKKDNGKYIGNFQDFSSSPLYGKFWFSFRKENGKLRYVSLKKSFWGFKIGEFVFRRARAGSNVVLGVLKEKGKIFYVSGALALRVLGNGGESGWTSDSNALFYSDNYESEVYTIGKILKKEKDDNAFLKLNKCIEKSKKLEGNQARFNSYKSCIENF